MANGGDIQHWRSRPFERRDMKVVKRDLTIKPISGSKSVDFLVERGTNVKVSDQVRARIYYFDDYSVDNGKPEMFSDIDMRELESFINIFHT